MMMNKIGMTFLLCVITAVVMMMNVLSYAEYKFLCPSELTVQQSVVQDASGWKIYGSHKRHPFVNLSFSERGPEEEYSLVPEGYRKAKGAIIAEWELPRPTEGYWVLCEYKDTRATVARKLPEDVAYCEVEYDSRSSEPVVKKWHCLSEAELKKKAESKKRKSKGR